MIGSLALRLTSIATLAVLVILGPGRSVLADDGTPVPIVTPIPTVDITSLPVPSPESSPLPFPTVARENSTPVISTAPLATEAPLPSSTPVLETRPTPTAVAPSPAAAPPPLPSSVPLEAPLPSAAELELNARLRWGNRVPAAVRRWAFLIVPTASRYHVDPNLVAAVITMESGGDPLAWNARTDARGLMQVLHGPWDPAENIDVGVRMLRGFLDEFGDITLALAAYNAGPNAVLSYGGVPPYRETRDYVIVVRYLYDLFGHHKLTHRRKQQYRATLGDLQQFAAQRRKVLNLARIAGLSPDLAAACRHFSQSCNSIPQKSPFQTLDPFWPIGGAPDPLQQVSPAG